MTATSRSRLADAARAALAKHKGIAAWQLTRASQAGLQTYLVKTQLESQRQVRGETVAATVFVKNGELLGSANVTFREDGLPHIDRRVDDAVFMAGLGGVTPWSLPGVATFPQLEMFDPALAGTAVVDTSRMIADTWRDAVKQHGSEVRPSSMEVFCGENEQTLENSSGLLAHSKSTRVSLLTMLLADGTRPSERYSWDERRRVADLDVAGLVGRAADEAHALTRAQPPPSGQLAVVIDAAELVAFLSPIQSNAAAESLYQKSSRFEQGKPIPIDTTGGEPFNAVSNALMPFGLASYAFDGNGIPGQRIEVIKDGVFNRALTTKQYADYLKLEPTGGFANWELPAGKTPLAELLSHDGPVLYVQSFSWLTPDNARGNFGSEIRVGTLYDKGAATPIKGGTVSGNVFSALGTAHYSKELVFRGDYLGPEAVRFEGLTVSGS